MFEFSSKTKVNRKFTMRELYKQIGADKDVKADSKVISSITLTNVLSNDTMNFNVKGQIKEIYVFEIVLADKVIPSLFISTLDKSIMLNTLFVLRYGNEAIIYGAYKEKGEKGLRFSKYYFTEWSEYKTIALPLGINSLEAIYAAIFDELIPIVARENETTYELIVRYEHVKKLERDIEKQQKLVDKETQPKKRFELNELLKVMQKEYKDIDEKKS